MARTARSGPLETRTARLKLEAQKRPYWHRTGKSGVHLGYRRRQPYGRDVNGAWLVRRYKGAQSYEIEVFAEADDFSESDGASVLTFHEAMGKLGGVLSEVQHRSRYTVDQAVDDYVAWSKLHRKSARDTEIKLRAYLVPYFKGRQLFSVKPHEFEEWLSWAHGHQPKGRRKEARKAPIGDAVDLKRRRKATLNRVINVVKACLNHAYKARRVPSDDAWRHLRRFKDADSARLQWLTVAECTRLLNASPPDFRRVLEVALLSGIRWGEARALRVCDFDVRSGYLLVAESKSGKPRRVPLSAEGAGALETMTVGRDPAEPLLLRADGKPWGEQDQKRPMAEACDVAKIKPAVGFHALRHTYASALVQAGVSLAIVAEALGHSDTRMVSRHYAHLAPSHVADAIRANLPTIGATVDSNVRRLPAARGA